jgi:hypothetical protein
MYHHGSFDYNRMPIAPMGCAIQVYIKPARWKIFSENLGDGFYLTTSEEHYRTHVVFAKKTRAKWLTNTVFLLHTYITQPTITPADAIVNLYDKLWQAIRGLQHSKDDAHFEALKRIKIIMQLTSNHAIKTAEHATLPRVEQVELTQHVPRVSFNYTPPTESDPLPRLIVALPKEQSVQPQPKPILEPPKFIDESIAAQVRAWRLQLPPTNSITNELIADQVARRRREASHSVFDQEVNSLNITSS